MDAARRRGAGRLAAAAGAVLLAVALLVAVARRDPPAPVAKPTPPPGPTARPSGIPYALEPPAALRSFAQLLDPAPRLVPVGQGGVPLRVDALSATGLLIGGAGFAAEPYRAADRVGVVEPGTTSVRWLTEGSTGTIHGRAAGEGVVAWAEVGDSGELSVVCARTGDGWRPRPVLGGGLDLTDRPVHADGGTVAWTDEAGRAWASENCGPPRSIGRGAVVGLAPPVAFVRPRAGPVEVVALADPGRATRLPVGSERGTPFAVSRDSAVWVANGGLVHYDRGTGRIRLLEAELPSAATSSTEATAELTVGNRLVAYTTRPVQGDPSQTRAVLYDLTTGAWIPFKAEVYVAGDRIVWREANHYAVTTTN